MVDISKPPSTTSTRPTPSKIMNLSNNNNKLAVVYMFKIGATVVFWVLPMLTFPASLLERLIGLPAQYSMFLRMLGLAYVALCVGYGMGLETSLRTNNAEILPAPIWVGLVSNGGACLLLMGYGIAGAWTDWHALVQFVLWSSVVATALITFGLYQFGAVELLKQGSGSRGRLSEQ